MKAINKVYSNICLSACLKNDMPMQLSKLISAQSAFETNNFTSNAFVKSNNGFGYKFVKGAKLQRPIECIHSTESDYYASYLTYENSIIEVCNWIKRRQKETKFPQNLITIQTPEQYAHLLKSCGYYGAKETDYKAGLEMYFNQLI